MDEQLRYEIKHLGDRFGVITRTLGAPRLHLVIVEPRTCPQVGMQEPPPLPLHLHGWPLAAPRRYAADAVGNTYRFWFYGDVQLLQQFDALCYRVGEVARMADQTLAEIDPNRDRRWDGLAMSWWPLMIVSQIRAAEADHLLREIPTEDGHCSALWMAEDVFTASAQIAHSMTAEPIRCSQKDIKHALRLPDDEAGLMKKLCGAGRLQYEMVGKPNSRNPFAVSFYNPEDERRVRGYLSKQEKPGNRG